MTIDSNYLRVFCALKRHLSFSRVAEELELTPSGISHCVKALETDLGCRLFERSSPEGLAYTRGGRVRSRCRCDPSENERGAGEAEAMGRLAWRGQLRIAADVIGCQHILPAVLREFRESFPKFTVRIDPCTSRQAIEALGDDRADLALTVRPQQSGATKFIPTQPKDGSCTTWCIRCIRG